MIILQSRLCQLWKSLQITLYMIKLPFKYNGILVPVRTGLCSEEGLMLKTSANKLFTAFNIPTSPHVDTFCPLSSFPKIHSNIHITSTNVQDFGETMASAPHDNFQINYCSFS